MQELEVSWDPARSSTETRITPKHENLVLRAPLAGVLVPLGQVPDAVFAQNGLGAGVAIDPTGNVLLAPCGGTILQVHSSGHALFMRTEAGLELLMHVGLDTVKLRGEGFNPLVQAGTEVVEGQPLIQFDADLIARKAKSLLTMLVVSHSDRIEEVKVLGDEDSFQNLEVRDPLIQVHFHSDFKKQKTTEVGVSAKLTKGELVQSGWILVQNPTGLHARPASIVVSLAKKFVSEIFLVKGTRRANARSLVSLMSLEVDFADQVQVEAQGMDASAAVEALSLAIRGGLGEKHSVPGSVPVSGGALPKVGGAEKSSECFNGRVVKGVMASPGQTVGSIFQLKSQEILVREEGGTEAQESARLSQALCEAKFQLETVSTLLKKEGDASQALIFDAHQELLDDPNLLDSARTQLMNGKSAAYAWHLAYSETAEQLASLNNALLAARATDVRDVGTRVLRLLEGVQDSKVLFPENCILVAEDLTPSDVAGLDRSRVIGLVTTTGGATSHVAILARSIDLPALAGAHDSVLSIPNGTLGILDATQGELRLQPTDQELAECQEQKLAHESRKKKEAQSAHDPAVMLEGRKVEIVVNLKGAQESSEALQMGAEGVGLLRTEFLFMSRETAPTEEEQLASYLPIVRAFGKKRPVIIRTLDVGGDKPLRYLPLPHEENPFLGERGLRVSLNRQDIFRTQLRAILRASLDGDVRIMFPMVSTLCELRQAKAILEEERSSLGVPAVSVGIMVEVPSAALLADLFARECDFFSIGSNDLAQYTLAIDRGHPKLAAQMDGLDTSVLRLIDLAVKAAHAHGKWVGVCGGIASDLQAVPILLGLGVDELSVSIPAVPSIKAQIRSLSQKECERLALRALGAETAAEIRSWTQLESF